MLNFDASNVYQKWNKYEKCVDFLLYEQSCNFSYLNSLKESRIRDYSTEEEKAEEHPSPYASYKWPMIDQR